MRLEDVIVSQAVEIMELRRDVERWQGMYIDLHAQNSKKAYDAVEADFERRTNPDTV